ncbi:hypothetical protein BH11PLA1_BH11PLA1_14120 [soil metagenome]
MSTVDALAARRVSRRILDQVTGSGTSVGANCFEADEAMSAKDFCKVLAIVVKELNETRFWLRLAVRREWVPAARLAPLLMEAQELKMIFGSMIARTRARSKISEL